MKNTMCIDQKIKKELFKLLNFYQKYRPLTMNQKRRQCHD